MGSARAPSTGPRREVMSAVAHYVAGVLPWDAMAEIIESLPLQVQPSITTWTRQRD